MLLLTALALAVQALMAMLQPWPLQVIFDYIILSKPVPETISRIAGSSWQLIADHLLILMISALIAVALLNGIGLYLQNITLTKVCQVVVQKLRIRLFAHILDLPVSHFFKTEPGEVIERITTDADDTQKLVEGYSVLIWRSIPTFIGIGIIMLIVDWRLALVTLCIAPILVWATYFFGIRIKRVARQRRKHEADISSLTETATKTHKWIKLLGLEATEIERMERATLLSRSAAVRTGSWQGYYTSLTNIVLAVGSAVLVLAGVISIRADHISPGELLVFMSYLKSLYKPVREFTKYYIKITKAHACNERIEQIMAITPCDLGVCDGPDAKPFPGFNEHIEFDSVSFGYEDENDVEELSFIIEKGQKVGLVGASGSGKSTLLNLIPRFFDVNNGAIRIDSEDIRNYHINSLRQHIVMVPQEAVLFHTTVRENISLGRPEEDVPGEEIEEAAHRANADEFIRNMAEGYDTILRSGTTQLSGGQMKRILIARAFLRDADIVLLDEPTGGLDAASEAEVMEAFDRLSKNRTILIASHQLKTIANADTILVLNGGRIVEQGKHEELLEQGGLYASFWKKQSRS
jgi:ABC-type multidrug transport system fused ATPase/permease subunit